MEPIVKTLHLYFSCSGLGSIWAAGSSAFPRVHCCVNEPQSSDRRHRDLLHSQWGWATNLKLTQCNVKLKHTDGIKYCKILDNTLNCWKAHNLREMKPNKQKYTVYWRCCDCVSGQYSFWPSVIKCGDTSSCFTGNWHPKCFCNLDTDY